MDRFERVQRLMGGVDERRFPAETWTEEREGVVSAMVVTITDDMLQAYAEAWSAQNDIPGNEVGARRRAGISAVLGLIEKDPRVVIMTREVFESMTESVERLSALEAAGVDSWEGYSHAMAIYHRMDETDQERAEREAAEDEAEMFRPKSCCAEARPAQS